MDKSKYGLKKLMSSFKYAFQGIEHGYTAGQNIIIMTVLAFLAVTLGIVFKIQTYEMLIVLVLIGIILPLELINTAIEAVVDLHDGNNKSKYGKIAKDCAAGALTIASIIAFVIGIIIFLPHIVNLF